MMKMSITDAKEGQYFRMHWAKYEVLAKCADRAIAEGIWACATHGETLIRQKEADVHFGDEGEHVRVWYCWFHGPEVP